LVIVLRRSVFLYISLLVAVLLSTGCPVVAPSVTGVSIDQSDSSLVVGDTLQLSVTVVATGGASQAVTWASSDGSVASVSAGGLVTALAVGSSTITATSDFDGSKSDSITVTVTVAPVPSVTGVSIDQSDSSTCQVSVELQGNTLSWFGSEFTIANPRFSLVGVAAGSVTTGCLVSAGPAIVGIICASAFTGNGPIALVTFERIQVGPSTFTVSNATLIDEQAAAQPVDGGTLAVD
jgi:hypothetical protein